MARSATYRRAFALGVAVLAFTGHGDVGAERSGDPLPKELEGVSIDEKLGSALPLELEFVTSQGNKVTIRDLVVGDIPTLVTFNYSNCPLLCSVQLNGIVEVMSAVNELPGVDYRMVTISLDPLEKSERSAETKADYLEKLRRARAKRNLPPALAAETGWTFVTGQDEDVRAIADAMGFGYTYHPGKKQYLHPATFMMITAKGTIAQYVYGVHFEPANFKAAITAASLGVTSKALQNFILACYHYEAPEGANGYQIMQYGGTAFAVVLVFALVGFHFHFRVRSRKEHVA